VLGAQWLSWKADGFNETGFTDESMNLAVKSQSETSLQARLGVRFSRAFESSRGFAPTCTWSMCASLRPANAT
jgi:uncharacterized protein with beta-barrel porin domain